jgi:hypothetical protein
MPCTTHVWKIMLQIRIQMNKDLQQYVLDIASQRLFKPVDIMKDKINKLSFLKLSFVNKGLDAIKDQFAPIISYTHITTKIFNDKKVL